MAMQKTAAGNVQVIDSAFCAVRGGTKVFFGRLSCGRFVVASRFQTEVRTANKDKAERVFKELCNA